MDGKPKECIKTRSYGQIEGLKMAGLKMAGLKIKNETVYVIYRNGKPYEEKGRKIVYTSKGAANAVITTDVQDITRKNFDIETGCENQFYNPKWYNLTMEEKENKFAAIKNEFKVVEYGPKGDK